MTSDGEHVSVRWTGEGASRTLVVTHPVGVDRVAPTAALTVDPATGGLHLSLSLDEVAALAVRPSLHLSHVHYLDRPGRA